MQDKNPKQNILESKSKIHYEGQPLLVFNELKKRKENLDNGLEDSSRPVLMVLGGTLRGCYGGGGVIALKKNGFTETFKTVVGLSTGAPTVAYFLSSQPEMGTSIYSEECLSKHFINLRNILSSTKNSVDIQYISDVWRGKIGDKKLDIEAIRRNPTKMLIAVTEYESGKQILFDAKTINDPVDCLQASASIPFLYKDEVKINGTRYVDGAVSDPLPITTILEKEKPTSILIFANRSKTLKDNLLRRLFTKISGFVLPVELKKVIRDEPMNFGRQLRILRQSKIPYTIIWTDDNVDGMEDDKEKIVRGAKDFETFILQMCTRYLLPNISGDPSPGTIIR